MSDLAPFVAAVIRDRVMAELKDENEALRQKIEALERALQERNPRRSVQVTYNIGKDICAENEINLRNFFNFGRKFSLFHRGSAHPDTPKALCLQNGSWLELWIDGGSSVRLQDLSFHYTSYRYVKTVNADGDPWKYAATIEARDDDDLNLDIIIFLSPSDHAKLLNREESADCLHPAEREDDRYGVEHSFYQEIPFSHLLELCGETDAVLRLSNWKCTEEWVLRHLMAPYVPY
jgi:hypothetical protein